MAITGVFQGALLQFGPVRLTNPIANTNSMFVARLDQFAVGLPEGEAGPAFSLLPNPAQGMVALTGLPPTGQVVQVLDVLGREVGRYRSQGETLQLDLRNLPTGLYVVRAGERSRRLVLE